MNTFKHLKNVLNKHISSMKNSSSLFVENPDTHCTRNRKLTFDKLIKLLLTFEAGALRDELLEYFDFSAETPTASAFVQARDKIKVEAFEHLFHQFNLSTHVDKLYKGYRLIAIDGSEIPIYPSKGAEETTLRNCNETGKSYSAFHLNASYDLLECTYDKVIIQGQAVMNENSAFCDIVDSYQGKKAIFIADRGYESYNGFEHVVHSGNKYLIRVKDINSKTSMGRSLGPYSSEEFDIDVSRTLTLKQSKEIKEQPLVYKFVPSNMNFDYMDKENPFYDFECRVVRFKISDDSYETIITNLDRDEFDAEEIKKLYHMRWGIETSFRLIKYALDLNVFHAKKRKSIKQEIFARLIIYNLSQRTVQEVKIEKKKRQHMYQVNFTRTFRIVRKFLNKKTGKTPVENLIAKEILPIRPGRKNARHVKSKKYVCFNYRFY